MSFIKQRIIFFWHGYSLSLQQLKLPGLFFWLPVRSACVGGERSGGKEKDGINILIPSLKWFSLKCLENFKQTWILNRSFTAKKSPPIPFFRLSHSNRINVSVSVQGLSVFLLWTTLPRKETWSPSKLSCCRFSSVQLDCLGYNERRLKKLNPHGKFWPCSACFVMNWDKNV